MTWYYNCIATLSGLYSWKYFQLYPKSESKKTRTAWNHYSYYKQQFPVGNNYYNREGRARLPKHVIYRFLKSSQKSSLTASNPSPTNSYLFSGGLGPRNTRRSKYRWQRDIPIDHNDTVIVIDYGMVGESIEGWEGFDGGVFIGEFL